MKKKLEDKDAKVKTAIEANERELKEGKAVLQRELALDKEKQEKKLAQSLREEIACQMRQELNVVKEEIYVANSVSTQTVAPKQVSKSI